VETTSRPLPEPHLTRTAVARILGVSIDTLRRWERNGLISTVRVGRTVRVPRVELDRLTNPAPTR